MKHAERQEFDIFLSHASADKDWVLVLAESLEELGLRVWVDNREISVGENFVLRISDGLEKSRYMVLVLSSHTEGRPWVLQEWTSFMAEHGPLGRLLPVRIDSVNVPTILKPIQAIHATDRDVARVADELFRAVGDPSALSPGDARRLVLGRDLVFTLSRDGDDLVVIRPGGSARTSPLPWAGDSSFGIAYHEFGKLHREALTKDEDRADILRHAQVLGSALFAALFDADDAAKLEAMVTPDRARPVVHIRSDDDLLLSLPWELLHRGEEFLVREGRIDLIRTTLQDVGGETLLREPKAPFKLVVNVSAPEDSHLSYEAESYRITLATAGRCEVVPTELGTLEDLIETVDAQQPTGIHFSGHGLPGGLLFEDEEGCGRSVEVVQVIQALRQQLPDDRRLPPFFYLASCHGNDPAMPGEGKAGSSSAAVHLHKAGVTEVLGYFGPIADELSTRAEETIYEAITEGRTTRDAVRLARERLKRPFYDPEARHRPMRANSARAGSDGAGTHPQVQDVAADTHPFAWAQLVLYHRGPEWPLSVPVPVAQRRSARVLQRRFQGFGGRKVLQAGFIGRRSDQHRIRRRLREGARVLVLQGLGGLGKSTLAQQVLPWLTKDEKGVCTLWCQGLEGEANRAEALVGQLLGYCRRRLGLDWEVVVQKVDQDTGDDPATRFVYFLQALLQAVPETVLYFDNLESLLIGPTEGGSSAIGEWAEPSLQRIWQSADHLARETGKLYLIASCRYRNGAFRDALLPVSPLPADALFRLTEWFPALRKLTLHSRARLVSRLAGHPRAVEYANDLVGDALTRWCENRGEWTVSAPPKLEEVEREWEDLVAPYLPKVSEKLRDDLLLQALWDRVLDDRERRFLYRMTVLRRPAEWDLLGHLGDPCESLESALRTAGRLRDTSLLEQLELQVHFSPDQIQKKTCYSLHPETAQFVRKAQRESPQLIIAAHRRIGEFFESITKVATDLEAEMEAGHHLFQAGEYDRAYHHLGWASDELKNRGYLRQAIALVQPFLAQRVQSRMKKENFGRLLGTFGSLLLTLGDPEAALEYLYGHLNISRELGDTYGEGLALGNLGNAFTRLGRASEAVSFHERHMVLASETNDRRGEAMALTNLGITYRHLGCLSRAVSYHEMSLAVCRDIGNRLGEAKAAGNLGNAYLEMGHTDKAVAFFEQDLAITHQEGDLHGEAIALENLGRACMSLGKIRTAIVYFDERLAIARAVGDQQGEGVAIRHLGGAYSELGETQKALRYFEHFLGIAEATGDQRGVAVTLQNAGVALAKAGRIREAVEYFEKCLATARQLGDQRLVGRALCDLGAAYVRQSRPDKATPLLEEAKSIGEEIRDRDIVGLANQIVTSPPSNDPPGL